MNKLVLHPRCLSSSIRRFSSANSGQASNRVALAHESIGNSSAAHHAVFLHGILGSKRNWRTVCMEINKRVAGLHSVSVDHRGHGGSAKLTRGAHPSNETVLQCADDISYLLHNHLNISPSILCAHSFGGKVALKYLENEMKNANSNSNRKLPSDVWILDSIPGPYTFNNSNDNTSQSVKAVFRTLSELPTEFESNNWMINKLLERGIEKGVAQWLATNIITDPKDPSRKTWEFDINTVNLLFDDFCKLDLWSFLESYRGSSTIHFLRAGKNKGWVPEIVNRFETIEARSNGKVRLHTMPHVGHWLHVEDMKGMLDMIVTNSSKMM